MSAVYSNRAASARHLGLEVTVSDGSESAADDEVTRHLSAAAHLDAHFAEKAIRELLAEPLRATPPSPGVDAHAVLRECIAARARRRRRDLTLAALVLTFAFVNLTGLLTWLVTAVGWRMFGPHTRRLDRGGSSRLHGGKPLVAVVAFGVLLVIAFASIATGPSIAGLLPFGGDSIRRTVPSYPYSFPDGSSSPYGLPDASSGSDLFSWLQHLSFLLPALLSLLVLAVLIADRWAVWSLLTRCFNPGARASAIGDRFRGEHWLRTVGSGPYQERLRRFEREHDANTVVYRGKDPFVGGGSPQQPWSIAIALEPDADHAARAGAGSGWLREANINVHDLYQVVENDLSELREASSLSPSNRLADLRVVDQVLVASEAVPVASADPAIAHVFANWQQPPAQRVDDAVVSWIRESPREWMRYYACYRVDGWSRDVVVSLYVHFGTDDKNLYIDCFPCVLPPILPRYRTPDTLSRASFAPALLDAIGSWLTLPLTVPGRTVRALSRIGPDRRATDGERYGARLSLREIAASGAIVDYMQLSDANRYLQILQKRLNRAVGCYLESRGVSVVDFMRQADQVQEFTVYGGIHNSVVGGQHGNVSVLNRTAEPSRGSASRTATH